MSVDLGTEIFKDPDQVAEWTVSDFDILVPKRQKYWSKTPRQWRLLEAWMDFTRRVEFIEDCKNLWIVIFPGKSYLLFQLEGALANPQNIIFYCL